MTTTQAQTEIETAHYSRKNMFYIMLVRFSVLWFIFLPYDSAYFINAVDGQVVLTVRQLSFSTAFFTQT